MKHLFEKIFRITLACVLVVGLLPNTALAQTSNALGSVVKKAVANNIVAKNTSSENVLTENTLAESSYTKVYRMYNYITSEHLWTTSASEYDQLKSYNWNQENVGWVCPVSSDIPVYRLYNSGLGTHHYTANKSEADELVSSWGWTYDNNGGAQFYSLLEDDSDAKSVYELYNPDSAQTLAHVVS